VGESMPTKRKGPTPRRGSRRGPPLSAPQALSRSLQGVGKALEEIHLRHHYLPVLGSAGEAEWARNEIYAGGWTDTPVADAYSIATMKLAAARDHVSSLAQLIAPDPAPFATAAVARALLETSARAWWLLDPRSASKAG
jgi:hypothetical protein